MNEEVPRWIPKEEICLFCNSAMPLHTAYVRDDETAVEAWYQCSKEKCKRKFGMRFSGKGYVESFKKALDIPDAKEVQPKEVAVA
jgi:hypothetical protein